MHYFENETIMSLENALVLKPNEISVLEHVRTYEYGEEGEIFSCFVEIRCLEHGVAVKKNRILDFPRFETEKEEFYPTVVEAIEIFRKWVEEILTEKEKQ